MAARAVATDPGAIWAEIGRREARAGRRSRNAAFHELRAAEEHEGHVDYAELFRVQR